MPGQGDDGLGAVFSLFSLSVVERPGQWVPCGDSAESALEEDAFEGLVAAMGMSPVPGHTGLSDDRRRWPARRRGEPVDGADIGDEFRRQYRPHPASVISAVFPVVPVASAMSAKAGSSFVGDAGAEAVHLVTPLHFDLTLLRCPRELLLCADAPGPGLGLGSRRRVP